MKALIEIEKQFFTDGCCTPVWIRTDFIQLVKRTTESEQQFKARIKTVGSTLESNDTCRHVYEIFDD